MILVDIELLKIIIDNASTVKDGLTSGYLAVTLPDASAEECARLTETIIHSQEMIIEYVREMAHAAVSASQDAYVDGLSASDEVMLVVPATPIEA
jgi:hypothetical protein